MEHREEVYGRYFWRLLHNRIPELNTPLYHRRGRFLTDRVAFKMLHGGEDIVPWFADAFQANIVILVRHPIPTVLSHKQFPRLPYFLDQRNVRRRLTDRQRSLVQNTIQNGTTFERGIVDWCLHYTFMLGHDRRPDWLVIPYEDLVLRPEAGIRYLSEGLGLSAAKQMLTVIRRPSLSSRQSDQEARSVT